MKAFWDWLTSIQFAHPWLNLCCLLAIPVVWWTLAMPGVVRFSSLELLPKQSKTFRTRFWFLPAVFAGLATICISIALAGPRQIKGKRHIQKEGIAIMMVMDISGSMQALDLSPDREKNRLDVVKEVFIDFVQGSKDFSGRPNDAIGIVSFARYPDTVCPLTLDHENLINFAKDLQIVNDREEDGTAIGDGLGLAVERLYRSKANSKVAILLTDGVNNAGVDLPQKAADLAKQRGIKVYTIGAGTNGFAPVRAQDPFSGRTILQNVPVEIDEDTLREIAERTGGQYFRATDGNKLMGIYEQIDRLEKTRFDDQKSRDYRPLYETPLTAGLGLAVIGWLLAATLFRRLP